MAMHKFVIADLMRSRQFRFETFFEKVLFCTQEEASALLSQMYQDTHGSGGMIRDPLKGLLGTGRTLYKRLITISNGPSVRDKILYDCVLNDGAYGVIDVAEIIRTELNKQFPQLALLYGDILVDVPHKKREYLGSNVLVYLDRDPDKGRNLAEGEFAVSPLLTNLSTNFDRNVKKCRIFIHPDALELLNRLGNINSIRDGVRSCLETHYEVPKHLAR